MRRKVKKEKLLQDAVQLFETKGYRATSLSDIANRSGISQPAFYHYFKSKRALLSQIFQSWTSGLTCINVLSLELPPDVKLRQFLLEWTVAICQDTGTFNVYLSETRELHKVEFKRFLRQQRDTVKLVSRVYQEGIEAGIFVDVDPYIAALMLMGACNSVAHWFKKDGKMSTEQIADSLTDIISKGYLRRNTGIKR
jgi:TetR/AcrR family transcriptional regulator, cholesterol catabolism regulator